MPDLIAPTPDDGPRLVAREGVRASDRASAEGGRAPAFEGRLRDHDGLALFASFEAFYRFGNLPEGVCPLRDLWERLPGPRPRLHLLRNSLLRGAVGWPASGPDVERFRRVWVCPEPHAVAALNHLRAVAGLDGPGAEYWQANVSEVPHEDVDADFRPVKLRVAAFGVSSTTARWWFDGAGVLRRGAPDPEVARIGAAVLAGSHTPHRAAEPREHPDGIRGIAIPDAD